MKNNSAILNSPAWYAPYAKIRTDSYVLLAALLNSPPSEELLALLQNLRWDEDIPQKMQTALADISRSGTSSPWQVIGDEFNRLFVGLGHGELVPYGSWYLEKMIQSRPLAAIRSDLRQLGIVRQPDTGESEDHAGALCEIMALITDEENGITHDEQAHFFEHHVFPWMKIFFRDMQSVQHSLFYSAVGRFGTGFLETEHEYLQNNMNYQYLTDHGGMQNDNTVI
jgi:TorA maturation chaperone TorD